MREQDKVFEAIAEDIDLCGAIIVKTSDGNTRKIFSPEIILRNNEPVTPHKLKNNEQRSAAQKENNSNKKFAIQMHIS
jgi:hypothetical protein